MISYSRRDKKKKTKIPGPQDYCVRVSFFKIPFSPFLFFFSFFSSFLRFFHLSPRITQDALHIGNVVTRYYFIFIFAFAFSITLRLQLNPYIESSVLKKSFNVTLGKERFAGDKRNVKSRLHRGYSRKALRWFAAPIKDYRHCPITCLTVSGQ